MNGKHSAVIEQCLELVSAESDSPFSQVSHAAPCGLQRLAECPDLPVEFRSRLREVVAAGFTLRSQLPMFNNQLISEWLGQCWWFMHQSQLAQTTTWSGIVGSRLNRTDEDFCGWPSWIEEAVRALARDHRTLLLVDGTTTTAIVGPLARQAKLNCLSIQLPPEKKRTPGVGQWLIEILDKLTIANNPQSTLWLSGPAKAAVAPLEQLPLRDRAVFALAHRLVALSIRPQGIVAELLGHRLRDERFPIGTVSIRLPSGQPITNREWLDQQAVGWYLPTRQCSSTRRSPNNSVAADCSANTRSVAVSQWTAHASLWHESSGYLLHCVRGDDGQAFRNGQVEAVLDAVAQGELKLYSPYEVLLKVLASRRVRASGKLLRTGTSAVSFTAVPLLQLMKRRRYQAHLGRWDWEPYGLMMRRDVLEQLGARPVIYGDEALFEHLDADDRHFFQPARRRSARSENEHWQAEEEWRLLDDVRLGELPPGSLVLFVETAVQAQALAAHGPWPVIYLQADRTQRSPTAAKRRRHSSARTNKS